MDIEQIKRDYDSNVLISKATIKELIDFAISSKVSTGATIDSDEFQDLLNDVCFAFRDDEGGDAQRVLTAYIDARLAAANHKAWCAEVNADGAREELAEVRKTGNPLWISVDERLPEVGVEVVVYSPPTEHDWPGSINLQFDCLDPDAGSDGVLWLNHSNHYEEFCCAAKPEGSIGPSEKAPYTHWMQLPPAPAMSQDQKGGA